MAGKVWEPTKAKKFARELEFGKSYYVIANIATNLAPYEDPQMYSEYVFTERLSFTGNPCTEGGMSAVTLCQNFGPVYEDQPRSMRRLGSPGPQVAGPVPEGYEAYLDEAEIRGLEKHVADGSDPKRRRPLGSRRV
ncbi:hypothetical protein ACLQ18_27265 [Streptomyces sp. DT193]|uniref:hypothetical protein n=1 Tax=Streptomyces sp. DT193 TaxID=3393418 RepID=UPI003CF888DF